jgi:hypothetical protein
MKLFIFWHIYCTQDVKQQSDIIVERQWNRMKKYGLIDKVEKIVICKVGNASISLKELFDHLKVEINECGTNGHEYETTSRLRKWAIDLQNKIDVSVLYIHNRGSTRSPNESTQGWTQCMEHYLISRHNDCISQLEGNKLTVGCALKKHFIERGKQPNQIENMMFAKNGRPSKKGVWHYSGNFWWAKASYIATLPEPHKLCRYRAGEDWILCSTPDNEINNHYCILNVPKRFDSYKMITPHSLYEVM